VFFSFPAQRSRAARSDEMEKKPQVVERNGEKKSSTFVTEKREVSFLKKGSSWQRRKLEQDCAQEWPE
jgi:hypothetical protein